MINHFKNIHEFYKRSIQSVYHFDWKLKRENYRKEFPIHTKMFMATNSSHKQTIPNTHGNSKLVIVIKKKNNKLSVQ